MNITLSPILARLKQELTDLYGDRPLHLTIFSFQALDGAVLSGIFDGIEQVSADGAYDQRK